MTSIDSANAGHRARLLAAAAVGGYRTTSGQQASKDMITLYGDIRSRAHRVVWMLKELGIEYRPVSTPFLDGSTRTPEFRRINPNWRVPALVDGDFKRAVAVVLRQGADPQRQRAHVEHAGHVGQRQDCAGRAAVVRLQGVVSAGCIARLLKVANTEPAAKPFDAMQWIGLGKTSG